jgi:arabinofuranosyltransferase
MNLVAIQVWVDQHRRQLFATGCVLLMAVFVLHSLTVNYSSDDGYIAFQYVKNFLLGNGIVYNPGERVEGYNNFLWIMLLAVVSWLLPRVELLHIAQALGIAFGALTVLLVCRFSRMVRPHLGIFSFLAGAFVALHSGLAAWSTGGLETTLYAFLVFAASFAYISYLRTGKHHFAVPILFALAVLTRPDAVLFFGVTLLHFAIFKRRNGERFISRTVIQWVLIFLAIFLPYYWWRFTYYGYLLPNTFYAKLGGSGSAKFSRGLLYLFEYLKWYGAFIIIPPLVLLLRRPRQVWVDYFALLVGVYLLYVVSVGGDGLAFFRFVAYIAPLIYVLVQEGFADLYERAQRASFSAAKRLALALVILVSLSFTMRQTVFPLLFGSQSRWYEPHSQLYFPGAGDNRYLWFDNYFVDRQAVAAKWLDENAPAGSLVASTPAGSIAYHLKGKKVIDMLGLNDEHIAHTTSEKLGYGRAGHEKGDGKYVLSRSPDYILMGNVAVLSIPLDNESMAKKLILKSEHELWDDPEFHDKYELQCVRLAESGLFQYFTFFKRKDLHGSATAANLTETDSRRTK